MRGFVVVRLNNAKAKHANTIAQPGRTRAPILYRDISAFHAVTRRCIYCSGARRRTALSGIWMER